MLIPAVLALILLLIGSLSMRAAIEGRIRNLLHAIGRKCIHSLVGALRDWDVLVMLHNWATCAVVMSAIDGFSC